MALNDPIVTRDDDVVRSKVWTAIIVSSIAAGITGAAVRHVMDDDQANLGTRVGVDTGAPDTMGRPTVTPRDATVGVDTER